MSSSSERFASDPPVSITTKTSCVSPPSNLTQVRQADHLPDVAPAGASGVSIKVIVLGVWTRLTPGTIMVVWQNEFSHIIISLPAGAEPTSAATRRAAESRGVAAERSILLAGVVTGSCLPKPADVKWGTSGPQTGAEARK